MSECDLGRKWEQCLADAIMKIGTECGLWFCTGLGMPHSRCQHDFQAPCLLRGKYVKEHVQ
ncbi:MICOS complex subunit MIC10-like [Octodon degus]|uniref:MICOS complex subunit MIC10-like n=1 Tax=Octodon degus TaxID=10160 RepID=A0A6P3EYC6_OCTDE|nr:MICOS complex subunit MIC10-like [Octodon degus]